MFQARAMKKSCLPSLGEVPPHKQFCQGIFASNEKVSTNKHSNTCQRDSQYEKRVSFDRCCFLLSCRASAFGRFRRFVYLPFRLYISFFPDREAAQFAAPFARASRMAARIALLDRVARIWCPPRWYSGSACPGAWLPPVRPVRFRGGTRRTPPTATPMTHAMTSRIFPAFFIQPPAFPIPGAQKRPAPP